MLQIIVDWFVYSVLNLDPASKTAAIIDFFIYDSVKVLSLLFFMIWAIGFVRTYLPQTKLRQWLSGKKRSHVYASLFGAVTPFCSCSSIPIFISFLRAGIPLGVSFSFLITSPLINEYLVVLMIGFFGIKITALYVISGILIGSLTGMLLGTMRLEQYLVGDIASVSFQEKETNYSSVTERIGYGFREAKDIVRKLWLWVLLGVAIGAFIHNYVPTAMIEEIIGRAGFLSVPIATIVGVPLYGSCAAILPIAVVLFQKGVPLGTALAFMMAIVALSLPEAIMLRRVMRLPLIGIFFAVTALAIILTGYLFNFLY